MKTVRQRGQSMTEYLVVLGVTGAALLAASTDVGTLFDNLHASYNAQSSEMNKVQQYSRQKVRFSANPSAGEDIDDGDTLPPDNTDLPETDAQLPSVEWVYDANGKLLGKMDGDMLVDEQGNPLAWCQRSVTGECVFVDGDGNIVFPGASSQSQWVDDEGNELPLLALTKGGKVYGFAYLYRNKYYNSANRSLLDPQPTGFKAEPMRKVYEIKDGKPQLSGYELKGQLYAYKHSLELSPGFSKTIDSNKEELVSVHFSSPPNSNWDGYKPCLVMPAGWNVLISNGAVLSGGWEKKFNDPSQRLSIGSLQGAGGFVDSSAADCGGASAVSFDSNSGNWTLQK